MSPDLDALADVIAMAVERATAPLLERLAAAETRVAAVAGMEAAVTGLRERVVVAETKAAMVQPAPTVDLSPIVDRLASLEVKSSNFAEVRALDSVVTRLDAVERRPVEDVGVRERVTAIETKAAAVLPVDLSPLTERLTALEMKSASSGFVNDASVDARSFELRLSAVEQLADDTSKATGALQAKSTALESRIAEPNPLAPVLAKAEQAVIELTKDVGALRERVAVVEVRPLTPGPAGKDGRDGADGKDGADGLGFDDVTVEQEADRSFTIKAIRGDRVKTIGKATFPVLIQRGVFAEGTEYERGDVVTWGGSQWHCSEPTTAKPGGGSKAWTLVVKCGRDGKDGKDAPGALPVVTVGSRG